MGLGLEGYDQAPNIAQQRKLHHLLSLLLAQRDSLWRLTLVGDGHVLEAGRSLLLHGDVLHHGALGGRVEHDGDAERALLGVLAGRVGEVDVLDLGSEVGEDDDVMVGEREVLRVRGGEERRRRVIYRQVELAGELREAAGLG